MVDRIAITAEILYMSRNDGLALSLGLSVNVGLGLKVGWAEGALLLDG